MLPQKNSLRHSTPIERGPAGLYLNAQIALVKE